MDYSGKMIQIRNTRVYGLPESVLASGYPMSIETPTADEFAAAVGEILGDEAGAGKEIKRAGKLGAVDSGTGHDCFLKGILVQADIQFPQYIWQQAKRYHWFDFVSSQSTMHRITKMDVRNSCNAYVDARVIDILEEYIAAYHAADDPNEKRERFHAVIANIPSGFLLTARITTNYLQLKTMYLQRQRHKMKDWNEFCGWVETLPHFADFVIKG